MNFTINQKKNIIKLKLVLPTKFLFWGECMENLKVNYEKNVEKKSSFLDKFLNILEKAGNKLPDPVILFLMLCAGITLISGVCHFFNVSAVNPATNKEVFSNNLLSGQFVKELLMNAVTTFQTFPPLGMILVTMIGIGIADKSGFLRHLLKVCVNNSSKEIVYYIIVLIGIIFAGIGDAGFVVLPPLAALLFINMGKNPIIGILLALAGSSVGFAAGIFVGLNDILVTSFTIPAAKMINPNFMSNPAMTIYFNITNTLVQTFVITWVTKKYIEPRFPAENIDYLGEESTETGENEKIALKYALISLGIYLVFIFLLTVGANAFLRDSQGSLISTKAPMMAGLIPIITLAFLIPGLIYGVFSNSIKSDKDAVGMVSKSIGEMGGYIFFVFVAAQFLFMFGKSNLGIILAIKGADKLSNLGLTGVPLIVLYCVLVGVINLFLGSASAKWAILSPVFVPMFMLLGYSPALTQAAYRVGDSSTNMISPLMPYLPLVLAVAKKYKKDFGIGTLIANMMPYALITLFTSIVLLSLFFIFNIPLGV